MVEISWNNQKQNIFLDDILYIEYYSKKLLVRAIDGKEYNASGKIGDLEKDLRGYNFVRIHYGYLLNLKYLKNIKDNNAVLDNNEKLAISKKYIKELRKLYAEMISGVVI